MRRLRPRFIPRLMHAASITLPMSDFSACHRFPLFFPPRLSLVRHRLIRDFSIGPICLHSLTAPSNRGGLTQFIFMVMTTVHARDDWGCGVRGCPICPAYAPCGQVDSSGCLWKALSFRRFSMCADMAARYINHGLVINRRERAPATCVKEIVTAWVQQWRSVTLLVRTTSAQLGSPSKEAGWPPSLITVHVAIS